MDYLQSLSLRDLLIFSPESYFQIFELSNKALWPFQIALILLTAIVLFLFYKRHPFTSRLIFAWLACVWCFVAYWYFGQYYSQISTYAHNVSYFYYAQAFLLLCYAIFTRHDLGTPYKKPRWMIGGSFIFYGLLIHPIVSSLVWSQPLTHLELFSVAPDPTAIATIGFIILLPVKGYLLLTAIPSIWLLLSVMTYQAF